MERNILKCELNPTIKKVKVGIDEAGRGPVLGYLVYGCIIYESNKNYGFKDSKSITKISREQMYNKIIQNKIGYIYNALHPQYLSNEMNLKSLNQISHESVFRILDIVFDNYKNCEVFIDGLGNNDKYLRILNRRYPGKKFVIKNRADSIYDVVSGASILAKVIRDKLLSNFTNVSGYPSDPDTITWLINKFEPVFGFPEIARFSWQTVKRFFKNRDKSTYLKGPFKTLSIHP
ncbi:Ribonuclease H2 subunit A [Dictyocoela muelleri]|nr:Ribonuclease H2 subunit A [Dictyocoela muelleri]